MFSTLYNLVIMCMSKCSKKTMKTEKMSSYFPLHYTDFCRNTKHKLLFSSASQKEGGGNTILSGGKRWNPEMPERRQCFHSVWNVRHACQKSIQKKIADLANSRNLIVKLNRRTLYLAGNWTPLFFFFLQKPTQELPVFCFYLRWQIN